MRRRLSFVSPLRASPILVLLLVGAAVPARAGGPAARAAATKPASEPALVLLSPEAELGAEGSQRSSESGPVPVEARHTSVFAPSPICSWAALVQGATPGTLGPEDCRWGSIAGPDGSGTPSAAPVDVFELRLDGRSTLDAGLEAGGDQAAIGLFNANFDLLVPPVPGADLAATLPAGRYLLAVLGLGPSVQTAYRLAVLVEAAATPGRCEPVPLVPGEDASGRVEPAGCLVFDYIPRPELDRAAVLYEVVLSEAGELRLALSSDGAFVPLVSLLSAGGGREIATARGDDEGATAGTATLVRHLAAGRYWVMAATAEPGLDGGYVLNSEFLPAAARCAAAELTIGEQAQGQLEASDCRAAYLSDQIDDESAVDVYRVVLPQRGTLRLAFSGEGFSSAVRIFGERFEPVLTRPDALLSSPQEWFVNRPGTYHVAIQGADGELGPYTLLASLAPEGVPCAFVTLTDLPQQVEGTLGGDDCRPRDWADYDLDSRIDLYYITLSQRARLSASLASSDVAPYLWVVSSQLGHALEAGASAPGEAARLDRELPPGDYFVVADASDEGLGAYRLDVGLDPAPTPDECGVTMLSPGAAVDAALDASDCRLFDYGVGSRSPSRADAYRLLMPSRGNLEVRVETTASGFFPRIALRDDATGALVAAAGSEDFFPLAELAVELPQGAYALYVDDELLVSDEPGDYRLETQFFPLPEPECREVDIAEVYGPIPELGLLVEDRIDVDDCLLMDSPNGGYDQAPAHQYLLTVPQRGELRLVLRSEAFEPFLALLGWHYDVIDFTPNFEGLDEVEIALFVSPGLYRVQAVSGDLALGEYGLAIEFEPERFEVPDPTPGPSPTNPPGPTETPDPVEPTPTPGPGPGPYRIHLPLALDGGIDGS